jgi:glutamate-5-semialdehyde dehydrogenase
MLAGESARQAARELALAESKEKDKAFHMMADAVLSNQLDIIRANQVDLRLAEQKNYPNRF